jgi:hypothetical protein
MYKNIKQAFESSGYFIMLDTTRKESIEFTLTPAMDNNFREAT